ncbi:MAG: cation:proton antiporter domain-containing protein [Planctomycetota bacterium]|jgi:Kef-type K+ transport system membrane component KefB
MAEVAADPAHLNALLLVGLAIAGGALGARVFKRIHVPQVVGYIVIGIIVGKSGLGLFRIEIIDDGTLKALEPFNLFALGLIGFHIGGALKIETFRKYGRQFTIILLAQGLCAAILVGGVTFAAAYWGTGDLRLAGAIGLVLGAIASATAPAATVDVLTEYKAKGILTTTVLAIIGLDDALAVALFAVACSLAAGVLGEGLAISDMLLGPLYELGVAAALGGVIGVVLALSIRRIAEKDTELVIVVGAVLLAIGISNVTGADPIMTAMVLGFTLSNLAPAPAEEALKLTERFSRPVFVLFFVMAGARLEVGGLERWMWVVVGVYVVGRLAGKTAGAALGAAWSRAARVLRRYLGFCLASQAGLAVGLAILAGMRLGEAGERLGLNIGAIIIAVVATADLLFEIAGPQMVRHAIVKAGEAGRNVTEEDLIRSHTVGDVMNPKPPSFHENTPLSAILHAFSRHEVNTFPVVGDRDELKGLVTISEIRESLATEGLEQWLLATDLMGPVRLKVEPDTPLYRALEEMRREGQEAASVVFREDEARLAGMLEQAAVHRTLMAELLRRHAGEG